MTKYADILWLDLEMTGLDAGNDLILEVAAIATDWEFKEVATFEGIVKNKESALEERFATNDAFWSIHQQAKDSLFKQNITGKTLNEIENNLLAFIGQQFAPKTPVLLGGNSIHIDRRFITAQWPLLDARLHYRMLDVSAWKVVFEGKYDKRFFKPEAHRALEDIRGSMKELEYYLAKIKE